MTGVQHTSEAFTFHTKFHDCCKLSVPPARDRGSDTTEHRYHPQATSRPRGDLSRRAAHDYIRPVCCEHSVQESWANTLIYFDPAYDQMTSRVSIVTTAVSQEVAGARQPATRQFRTGWLVSLRIYERLRSLMLPMYGSICWRFSESALGSMVGVPCLSAIPRPVVRSGASRWKSAASAREAWGGYRCRR
jgi:hypothetical protein